MAEGGGDRTQAPTPRRLQRAREEGHVAISREFVTLGSVGAGLLTLLVIAPDSGEALILVLRGLLANAGMMPDESAAVTGLAATTLMSTVRFIVPVMAMAALGGLAAGLLQTGLLFRPAALLPDITRLDPRPHLRRMVGRDAPIEALKSAAKLVCFAAVLSVVVRGARPLIAASAGLTAMGVARTLSTMLWHGAALIIAVQLAFAGADYAITRHRHQARLRMSRQDLRDEQKEAEGDQQVRGRLRALRRRRMRQRMMQAVPRATVVLTNPTHLAVALAYDQGSRAAPRVVAKGADEVAARIRALAREHRVPLVENKPLARALFTVPLDSEIPREHFGAVAAVIAYVWRLAERARVGAGR